MKNIFMFLVCVLMISTLGCVEADAQVAVETPTGQPLYGCVVVQDAYGERQVCDAYYYNTAYGVVYYDNYFGLWLAPNGYWHHGWHRGFWPGYYNHFQTFQHTYHINGSRGVWNGGRGYYHGGGHHGR
jgi:hypothetical protein